MDNLKYFSLFSGIAGFELGIQQAYESNYEYAHQCKKSKQKKRSPRGKRSIDKHGVQLHTGNRTAPLCIGYSEVDAECDKCKREGRGRIQPKTLISKTRVKCDTCGAEKEHPAIQIYEKHFNHKNYGDITKINAKELPDFELLVGGFPCQAFSIAGRRRGFRDTRGTLFFEIARIIKQKQPRLLLLENVKGLLSHDNGNTFFTIISTLDELGYDCQWQVLNSKNFGVPQNRERVFIVGHLRGTPRPEVFPLIGTDSEDIEQINKPKHSNDRVYSEKGISPTLNTMQGGRRQPFIVAERGRYNKDGTTSQKLEARPDNVSNTLTRVEKDNRVVENSKIRRLTPTECERLQGFPDGWTKYGNDHGWCKTKISDTQRYKTLGNAVTVTVIREIVKKLNCG